MHSHGWSSKAIVLVTLGILTILASSGSLYAQAGADDTVVPAGPYEGRIIRDVKVVGLARVNEDLFWNNIRTTTGEIYATDVVAQDVRNLTRLNQFRRIGVEGELTPDGGVVVTFLIDEWPLVADIQVTGNTSLNDNEILQAIPIRPGDPLDAFQINRAREAIKELYKTRGFYLAEVEIDPSALTESGIVLVIVREGPRVKIKAIEFSGNHTFNAAQLNSSVRLKRSLFLLRRGQIDNDTIEGDINRIGEYYRNRGFLDVRVDRSIDLSNDRREAKITYLIDEGAQYTLHDVRLEGAERLHREQVMGLLAIQPGDVYASDLVRKSLILIQDTYGRLGYVDSVVDVDELRLPNQAQVDLVIRVVEGEATFTGEVRVIGNDLTKREVILREVPLRPGRPLSTLDLATGERRIQTTGLFANPSIRVQSPSPEDPNHRDVIIEVVERDTGQLGFGAAVSSDLGVFGQFDYQQRNFDIADFPESWDEFVRGRAFRGAGQTFNITLQPGDEFSNYSVSITEPYVFRTDNSLRASGSFTRRVLESWNEERFGGSFRLGRRIGRVWTGYVSSRSQSIDLSNIDPNAPTDVFLVEDQNIVTGAGFGVIRTTVDDRIKPTRGSRTELGFEQIGVYGGDFDFSRFTADHTVYLAVDEDFLGRKSVLSISNQVQYQTGGTTPIYERFYLGGRSFRGFDYRTVSPKGIKANNGRPSPDPVGGDFLFFLGLEQSFPIYGDSLGGVVFIDSGTVLADPGFDDYRISAGFGFRIVVDVLSQAPLAFDFGIPISKESRDEERFFSFSIDVPVY